MTPLARSAPLATGDSPPRPRRDGRDHQANTAPPVPPSLASADPAPDRRSPRDKRRTGGLAARAHRAAALGGIQALPGEAAALVHPGRRATRRPHGVADGVPAGGDPAGRRHERRSPTARPGRGGLLAGIAAHTTGRTRGKRRTRHRPDGD